MRSACGRTCRSSYWKRSTPCCRFKTAMRARASVVTGSTCSGQHVSGDTSRSDGEPSRAGSCVPPTYEPPVTRAPTMSTRSTTGDSRCTSASLDTTAVVSPSIPSNISTISSNFYGQVNISVDVCYHPRMRRGNASVCCLGSNF